MSALATTAFLHAEDGAPDTERSSGSPEEDPPPTLPSARLDGWTAAREAPPAIELVERSGVRAALRDDAAPVVDSAAWLDAAWLEEDDAPDTERCAPPTLRSARGTDLEG